MPSEVPPRSGWSRLREAVNWINGSTALGVVVARVGGADLRRTAGGTWVATGYRYRFPVAGAFTVGDVVLTRHDPAWLAARPRLMAHEHRHRVQYAVCAGVVMIPLYLVAAGVSLVVRGDPATLNPFERWAGLADGGYRRDRGASTPD